MADISSIQFNKSTSFHSIVLNISYIAILIFFHFLNPYIHELVYNFFNGLFLILSITLYFSLNLILRTSSITYFSYYSLFFRVISATIILALSIITISFLTNTTEIIIRDVYIYFILYVTVSVLLTVFVSKYFYFLAKPRIYSNIILLTDHDHSQNLKVLPLLKNANEYVNIKEFRISEMNSLINYAVEHQVEEVYIYINSKQLGSLENILKKLSIYAFNIFWILPDFIFSEDISREPIKPILLNESPVTLDTNQYLMKRGIDVLGSILILLLNLPLIIVVSIIIKASDHGPVLYRQKRYGRNGIIFNMLKFRSMRVNSHNPNIQVSNDDDRVTSIGKIIRKTSFDELPQLINVIRGEMSLVGPRPQTVDEIKIYSKKLIKFLTRHHVKPGLTGLAQIRTRVKTDNIKLMNEKLLSDLEYIKNWSLFLDIKILFLTPISMWKNRNKNA